MQPGTRDMEGEDKMEEGKSAPDWKHMATSVEDMSLEAADMQNTEVGPGKLSAKERKWIALEEWLDTKVVVEQKMSNMVAQKKLSLLLVSAKEKNTKTLLCKK